MNKSQTLAVVTGAGQGIGAAIARYLGARGDFVILASRNQAALATVGVEIGEAGGDYRVMVVDLSDPDNIARFVKNVLDEHGTPLTLVNAAGNSITKPALEVTPKEWDLIHDVHLRGTFFMCQGMGGPMGENGYGKIINLSSTWASNVTPGRSVYAIAKAGVSQLTSALAVEWASRGVRVNAVAPTTTITPRIEQRLESDPSLEERMRARVPMGRLGTVDDVARTVMFLASPESDFITGQTIYVDGGFQYAK